MAQDDLNPVDERVVRPYALSDGRTRPTRDLNRLTVVIASGSAPRVPLDPVHAQVLELCRSPITVAEVAAQMRTAPAAAKVVLSDLLDFDLLTIQTSRLVDDDLDVLRRVRDGLIALSTS